MVKLVDTQDLKSCGQQCSCGFKSRLGYKKAGFLAHTHVLKLVDRLDSGSSVEGRGGSSPPVGTKNQNAKHGKSDVSNSDFFFDLSIATYQNYRSQVFHSHYCSEFYQYMYQVRTLSTHGL